MRRVIVRVQGNAVRAAGVLVKHFKDPSSPRWCGKQVPVEKIKYVDKPVYVDRVVERRVEVPVEVERRVEIPVPYEKIVLSRPFLSHLSDTLNSPGHCSHYLSFPAIIPFFSIPSLGHAHTHKLRECSLPHVVPAPAGTFILFPSVAAVCVCECVVVDVSLCAVHALSIRRYDS